MMARPVEGEAAALASERLSFDQQPTSITSPGELAITTSYLELVGLSRTSVSAGGHTWGRAGQDREALERHR
jgi:hypothetical protein